MKDLNTPRDKRRLVNAPEKQTGLDDLPITDIGDIQSIEAVYDTLSGVEPEQEDDEAPSILTPFDPKKIRMNTQQMSLDVLINRMEDGRIDLQPDFQRKDNIWTPAKKSRLVESILIRIPLPAFYLDGTDDDRWIIIDGLQRLSTLKQFVIDKTLTLTGLEFLAKDEQGDIMLEGKHYDEIPRSLQRRIAETQVTVYFIQEGTPLDVKYNIFSRINTGGEPLSQQEIRNALNQGKATRLLKELAETREFLDATQRSIKPIRMADRELVLRFLAFAVVPLDEYRTNEVDKFLNDVMGRLNKLPDRQTEELKRRFVRAMDAARRTLGRYAFRKIYPTGKRGVISKALFDAWSYNLDRLTDKQIEILESRREHLIEAFTILLSSDEFFRSITFGTGDPTRLKRRFGEIGRIIRESLDHA